MVDGDKVGEEEAKWPPANLSSIQYVSQQPAQRDVWSRASHGSDSLHAKNEWVRGQVARV